MTHGEQQSHLAKSLWAVIERFRKEYELTYIDAMGALEYLKLEIGNEINGQRKPDEDGLHEGDWLYGDGR